VSKLVSLFLAFMGLAFAGAFLFSFVRRFQCSDTPSFIHGLCLLASHVLGERAVPIALLLTAGLFFVGSFLAATSNE
jgi:hypothetical protein